VAWQDTRGSDVADTCRTQFLHLPAKPAEPHFDSGQSCGSCESFHKSVGYSSVPATKKRVSQPLARTATLELYSLSPSHSVSYEEILKIQWPGSRQKLRFRPLSGPCESRPAVKEGLRNVRRFFGSTAPTSYTLVDRPVSNEHFQTERFIFIRLLLLSHQCCVLL
jgi:hypothetical protein